MKISKEGHLRYNKEEGRYGLATEEKWLEEGFHCGDILQVYFDGEWVNTSIEKYSGEWYLVELPFEAEELEGLRARIE